MVIMNLSKEANMLEIPEATTIAHQLNKTIKGKRIDQVIVNAFPHKFAFFHKDPKVYPSLLMGKMIGLSRGLGGHIEIEVQDFRITFSDGINLRYYSSKEEITSKHQFLLCFTDESVLVVTIQMYGFISVYKDGENINPYYLASINKPSPLSEDFSWDYFKELFEPTSDKLSVKAFLATEQRIPGLGNGVLQDILFHSRLNPRRKIMSLTQDEKKELFNNIKKTLKEMTDLGGRDIEKDLFGKAGSYLTKMSNPHLNEPCPRCMTPIIKEAYLGGNVYICPKCQPRE